jgi:hypothetical protein
MIGEILKYEEIDENEVEFFSNPIHWEKMKEIRGKLYKEAFVDADGVNSLRTKKLTWGEHNIR